MQHVLDIQMSSCCLNLQNLWTWSIYQGFNNLTTVHQCKNIFTSIKLYDIIQIQRIISKFSYYWNKNIHKKGSSGKEI